MTTNTDPFPQKYDFFALGEALIDFISTDMASSLRKAKAFHWFIGGQVTNLTMNIARLGRKTAIATCVGKDDFGSFIDEQLQQKNVDTTHVQVSKKASTSASIIARHTKTPDFIILRGVDHQINLTPAIEKAVAQSHIIHTSAFALSRQPARNTIITALQIAHQEGKLVSLDPNYHPHIWSDTSNFVSVLQNTYQFVDVTKPSLDDCKRIFGTGKSPREYANLFLEWGAKTVMLTMGSEGVLVVSSQGDSYLIQAKQLEVMDVTGAGDAFWAGALTAYLDNTSTLEAARCGQALAEIKIGAIGPLKQMPTHEQLLRKAKAIPYKPVSQNIDA